LRTNASKEPLPAKIRRFKKGSKIPTFEDCLRMLASEDFIFPAYSLHNVIVKVMKRPYYLPSA